ncbi:MAG: EAL domain-containing protein [Salinarimonas sp.]|nr:EAL domain-containing protein [Salinarimonas sp.]
MSNADRPVRQNRTHPLASAQAWTEQERLSALESYDILGTLPETAFDDIARIAARTFDAPMALVSFVGEHSQWFKSAIGLGIRETPREISFCAHAILNKGVFIVPDATGDARFCCNPLVTDEPRIRFYAGAVLRTPGGLPLGTICVLDRVERPEGQMQAQIEILEALARAVMRELEIRVERRFLQIALATMDQGLLMIEADGRVPIINARAAELLELPTGFVESQPRFEQIVAFQKAQGEFALTEGELLRDIDKVIVHATRYDYERTRPNGLVLEVRTVPVAGGGVVRTFTDITKRKAAENEIWRMANEDDLTGLPNRAAFTRELNQALRNAEADASTVSLLLIDLDEFKDVNDLLGHDAGDELLRQTANRLKAMVRPCDTVARLGGDEFAVIVAAPFTLADAARFAERLVEQLRTTFEYEGRTLSTKASIGVAAFPDHHRDVVELMKDADIALYRAKAEGRTRAVVYNDLARKAMLQRVQILQEVRNGLANHEFAPYYQPKIDLKTGRISGFEALARWQSPANGLLTPACFGSVFSDVEIANAFGNAMIRRIASDLQSWRGMGLECGGVAINTSSAEYTDPALASRFLRVLEEHRVPASLLEIEVTETVFLGRCQETVSATLRQFHDAGVRIALDDFGTGFASLMHLKHFPVDHIKIDQSFVRDMMTDRGDAAIVEAVIGLGRSFHLDVTAEGVETREQAEHLQALGCGNAQGYFYAKPMPGTRIPWFIRNWTRIVAGKDVSPSSIVKLPGSRKKRRGAGH